MPILLIIYFVLLIITGALGAAGVFHATSYGLPGDKTRAATVLYLFVAGLIILISIGLIIGTDFSGEAA